MGIHLADLIVESIIRDGIEFLKQNPARVDDIFKPLTRIYNTKKYGQAEIDKIKAVLFNGDNKKNIAIVHSFHEASAQSPCYSIQLGTESEAKERAHLGDFEEDHRVNLTNTELLAYQKITGLIPTAYDPVSGKVSVQDSADMSLVHPAYIYVDGSGAEFELRPGISNVTGNKFFFIAKQADVNIIDPGLIRSFITYSQHEIKGETSAINMLIGVHSKDALLTKYMYVILKYIMFSRKNDLIKRGIVNSTFQGSDFTRDLRYEGDMVFTRFFTLSGQVDDTWRSDDVQLIDAVDIAATTCDDETSENQED